MKKISFLMGLVALACLAALPASAGVLYDNDFGGVISGDNWTMDAWTLNFGYAVANSFVLPSNSTLQSINLGAWAFSGDTLTSVDWAIMTGGPTGTTVYSGTASPTQTFIETNAYGYDIDRESFGVGNLALGGGNTYWLVVQNAVSPVGNPIYWDQSDGASSAMWENSLGYWVDFGGPDNGYDCGGACTGSESFQLLGTPSGVPEPGTLALLGGALIALAGLRRRK